MFLKIVLLYIFTFGFELCVPLSSNATNRAEKLPTAEKHELEDGQQSFRSEHQPQKRINDYIRQQSREREYPPQKRIIDDIGQQSRERGYPPQKRIIDDIRQQPREREYPPQKRIINDMSWRLKVTVLRDFDPNAPVKEPTRRTGVKDRKKSAKRRNESTDVEKDDQNMKMKLFRLMYEMVRDSEMKVKRSELIRDAYANSTVFELGFLMGELTDKYRIMQDIAQTLQRMYYEWKPLEHISAYEQISNLLLDIGHILDMTKTVDDVIEKKQKCENIIQYHYPKPTESYFQINKK